MKCLRPTLLLLAGLSLATGAAAAPWRHYTEPTLGYTVAYPADWTIDTSFVSPALGPDHEIKGVAFQIPARMATGANLGSDTKLAIESVPGKDCAPSRFVDPADAVHKLHADGRVYTVAGSQDAGAGNRYETDLFVLDGASPCLAVAYLIHSTAIENYDPGTVKAFDRARLIAAFDRIRATLTLGK